MGDQMTTASSVTIRSLTELDVHLSKDVHDHLSAPYEVLCVDKSKTADDSSSLRTAAGHLDDVLRAMKTAPRTSMCRVNQILSNKEDVMQSLEREMSFWIASCNVENQLSCSVSAHTVLDDVVCIDISSTQETESLTNHRIPIAGAGPPLFSNWPSRESIGWPMTHKVIICDRFCGEAVLRGSAIFVRGILCADSGIVAGDMVTVYADIRDEKARSLSRGLMLDQYFGTCVFLGVGTACCKRADMFNSSKGLAVQMSPLAQNRAGPVLPPLHGILPTQAVFQNLPSIVVGHALAPCQGEVILDMCAAPGGKTSHLASLVRNQAIIVACDKSRKKMVTARGLFDRMGATCITPLALDSTDCVEKDVKTWKSVQEVLASAEARKKDGLLNVDRFYPESFDRILLDPPCSALGLRPKLQVVQTNLDDLKGIAGYQRKFVKQAVALLKPGGTMTYSTCTIHSLENEAMVSHIINDHPMMELVPIEIDLGLPGLGGLGLDERECSFVRRFHPTDKADTMGFFIAKFRKRQLKRQQP